METSPSETKIVNLRHEDFTMYIGRKANYGGWSFKMSKWANPFHISQTCTREECVRKYENYILSTPHLYNALDELRGHTLGCWCKPQLCHGDILIALLNKKIKQGKNLSLNSGSSQRGKTQP